jgi:hypothetical protein
MATLDTFGDVRRIYKEENLPFVFAGYPVTTMTPYRAEANAKAQGSIVLSSIYVLGATAITLSMIRDEGGLVSGDTAQVSVHINGRWK